MKGDFSRETFDPRKQYTAVLMQQGRVQVDADWNEQGAIDRYRDEVEAIDVIGGCGGPIGAAGFEITTDGETLFIGQGRYYVDGLLVENDLGKLDYAHDPAAPNRLPFDEQPTPILRGAELKSLLAIMAEKGSQYGLVYLDVWERHVTVLDDPLLREVALGGPDTATRLQTVWQVKLLPVTSSQGSDSRAQLEAERREIAAKLAEVAAAQDALQAQITEINRRLETTTSPVERRTLTVQLRRLIAAQADLQTQRNELTAALAAVDEKLAALPPPARPTCAGQFPEWDALFNRGGLLNARAQPVDPSDDPCELPPGAGYTRLENQLYRVEIHNPGGLGVATFKWSRDNGTVVARVEKISGGSVFVDTLGPDEALGFANGQWVELSDDALELNGLPGQLARIVDVKAATRELVLDPAPTALAGGATGVDAARHPKLRRWDQGAPGSAEADANGVKTSGDWLALEDGVEVRFSLPAGGAFSTGDYWLVPARTATGELEWPPFAIPNNAPEAQPRRGIEHHFCRLALVGFDAVGAVHPSLTVRVRDEPPLRLEVLADCRALFPPLTALPALAARTALHVTAINWGNDAFMPLSTFTKEPLRIRLDAPPDPASVSNDSVLVTLDFPFTQGERTLPNVRQRLVLIGEVGVDPNDPQTILWQYSDQAEDRNIARRLPLAAMSAARLTTVAARQAAYRINVTLRGKFIWQSTEGRRRHLDGQALGMPAAAADRTDLSLPSGDGARASDFESWFFLGGEEQTNPLRVQSVAFQVASRQKPVETILVVEPFPLDPEKMPEFGAGIRVNRIVVTFTRAAGPESEFDTGDEQPLLLERVDAATGGRSKRFVAGTLKGNILQFDARDPNAWSDVGDYELTVFGQEGPVGRVVTAQDDGSALDGDFDGQPGGNFVLRFRALD